MNVRLTTSAAKNIIFIRLFNTLGFDSIQTLWQDSPCSALVCFHFQTLVAFFRHEWSASSDSACAAWFKRSRGRTKSNENRCQNKNQGRVLMTRSIFFLNKLHDTQLICSKKKSKWPSWRSCLTKFPTFRIKKWSLPNPYGIYLSKYTRGLRSRCFTELHRKCDAGRHARTHARTHAETRKRVDIYKSASVACALAR